jgi:hypothetical protein
LSLEAKLNDNGDSMKKKDAAMNILSKFTTLTSFVEGAVML